MAGFGATQRLFRAEVSAGEEGATLRLTLRLWSEHRFELVAGDLAGRTLWRLAVADGNGRLDGGSSRRCRFDPASPIDLPHLRLAVEADALPAILLGVLPASVTPGVAAGEVRDTRDRTWEIERASGTLAAWRLAASDGREELRWRRDGDRFRLESPERALVVVWREKARSELRSPAPPLELEPGLADCRDLDLS